MQGIRSKEKLNKDANLIRQREVACTETVNLDTSVQVDPCTEMAGGSQFHLGE